MQAGHHHGVGRLCGALVLPQHRRAAHVTARQHRALHRLRQQRTVRQAQVQSLPPYVVRIAAIRLATAGRAGGLSPSGRACGVLT
jgi:hypothetical protein